MNFQSPFSPQISQEQKQVSAPLHQFWAKLAHEASLLGSVQSEQRAQFCKNLSPEEQLPKNCGRKGKRFNDQLKEINRGHWSMQQNKKYHWFLERHYKHFVNRHMRRTDKIFKTMEIFVGTRQAQQCRSHHQKMQKKYLSFMSIISNLRQIHYASQETDQLQREIQAHGIKIVESLASMQELQVYKRIQDETQLLLAKKQSVTKLPKQSKISQKIKQASLQCYSLIVQKQEQHKQREMQEMPNRINMFEELGNQIGEIRMYQEKEESGIFHSIFHSQQ